MRKPFVTPFEPQPRTLLASDRPGVAPRRLLPEPFSPAQTLPFLPKADSAVIKT